MSKTMGARVRYGGATEVVDIRGSEGACRVAKRLLESKVGIGGEIGFVAISTDAKGLVIGKKGQHVKMIKSV